MAKQYIQLYFSYLNAIEKLGDAERGRLFTAMLKYGISKQYRDTENGVPERYGDSVIMNVSDIEQELCGNEQYVFPMIRAQIDRDNEAYDDKCRENKQNGRLGGRPKKPNGFNKNRTVLEKPKEEGEGEGNNIQQQQPRAREDNGSGIVFGAYGRYFGLVTPTAREAIVDFLDNGMEPDAICYAFELAFNSSAKNWNYANAVLSNWLTNGIKTLEAAQRENADFKAKGARSHASNRANNEQPKPNPYAEFGPVEL